MKRAKIYKPSRTAMQSGKRNSKKWLLEFETLDSSIDPLMGWESSIDTMSEVKIEFSTKEQKIFLEDMLVKSDNISTEFKNVFSNFRIDYSGQDPVWRFDKTSGKTSDNFTDVFEGLGIFKKDGGNIYVPSDKNASSA